MKRTSSDETACRKKLGDAGVPPNTPQVVSQTVFDDSCTSSDSAKICVVMFVPHIYDSSAKDRQNYINTLGEVAKSFRGSAFSFAWSEGGAQEELEKVLEINYAYPTVAVLSTGKKVFKVHKGSWSLKNVKSFLQGVLSGR